MATLFEETFGPHAETRDKFESQFTIISFDNPPTELIEKVQHQLGLINLMSDRVKRGYLYARLRDFRDYLQNRFTDDTHKVTGIFLVGKETHSFALHDSWRSVVEKFDVEPFIFRHGEYFDLSFLRSLLTEDRRYDVITVSPTRFTHYHHNPSKRRMVHQDGAKTSEVLEYLKKIEAVCLVHGTGSVVSNLANNLEEGKFHRIIVPKSLRDTEITEQFERHANTGNASQLEVWLSRMLHPEYGKRLVFGKDIEKRITERQIKTLYCSPEMVAKIRKRVPADLLNFEIVEVKSYGDDTGRRLQRDYSGAVGITYY